MSKRRGLSLEEKREKMHEFILESVRLLNAIFEIESVNLSLDIICNLICKSETSLDCEGIGESITQEVWDRYVI
tara:strand:+ start:401 stop:622 length:222 start_codon:yes stop_codon:yes gene_type:complete